MKVKKIILCTFFLTMGFTAQANSSLNEDEMNKWRQYLDSKNCLYSHLGEPTSIIRCPSGGISNNEYNFPRGSITTHRFWDLDLKDNTISDLRFLNLLNEVVNDIDYQNNQLLDVDGLRNLEKVGRSINLSNNPLLDISGLKNLKEAQSIYISNTGIRDVDGLINLTHIRRNLHLNNNQINSLNGLSNLRFVAGNLNLSQNNIRSLKGLDNLLSAGIIDLRGNYSLKDLKDLENLQEVDFILLDNKIYDSMPRKGSLFCKNQLFRNLSLTGNSYLRPDYPITISFIRSCLR